MSKSDIISIRINEKIKNQLQEESEKNEISLNHLINLALVEYVGWNKHVRDGGWVTIFRPAFRAMISSLDEKEVIKIAEDHAKNELSSAAEYFYGKVDVTSITKLCEDYFQHMNVKFRHEKDDGKNKFIVKHDLENNWALYVITTIELALNEIGYKLIKKIPCPLCFEFEIVKIQ